MTEPTAPLPSGWFPDPLGRHEHRWFNGTSWTADVSDDGRRFVDPFGTAPGPGYGGDGPGGRNGLATAAMVCGLIALVTAWIPFVVAAGIALSILGIVLGIRGLRRARVVGTGRGFAITGIVSGGFGLALSVVGILLSVLLWRAVDDFIHPGPVVAETTACRVDGTVALVEGVLTNRSSEERDYTVFVTLDDRTEVVTVDDVPSDETVVWTLTMRAPRNEGCDPDVEVQGPFPFGIEIDPVE